MNQIDPICTVGRRSLNEKQHAAVELLLLGKSVTSVAAELNIERCTLYRWRQDELFIETLEQRRAELFADAAERLRCLVHRSLDVLELQLSDRYDRARYAAAAAVLRLARMWSEDKYPAVDWRNDAIPTKKKPPASWRLLN